MPVTSLINCESLKPAARAGAAAACCLDASVPLLLDAWAGVSGAVFGRCGRAWLGTKSTNAAQLARLTVAAMVKIIW